jgi:REP element-mobilizing transposase RayT
MFAEIKMRRTRARRKPEQLALDFDAGRWGGRRRGAGRPRKAPRPVAHAARPRVTRHTPVHVAMRLRRGLRRTLRSRRLYAMVRSALRAARERLGCRIVHYSVQGNHLHLLVEANGREALGRAMKGFAVRLARGLNRIAGRRGQVFGERYQMRVIRNPRQARNALVYVIQNAKKHALEMLDLGPRCLDRTWVDPFSSAPYFDGWHDACARWVPPPDPDPPVAPCESHLLTTLWRRHGLVDTGEVPRLA